MLAVLGRVTATSNVGSGRPGMSGGHSAEKCLLREHDFGVFIREGKRILSVECGSQNVVQTMNNNY